MAGHLDFYFFYGSIHSYLSVMRIGALASAAGVAVRWQPFNLSEILIEQNNTAFTKNDVKMNYFWHDVERRAHRHKIPFAGRAPYPADPDLLALRVGLIAAQEKWCDDYSRATFHDWFTGRRAQARHFRRADVCNRRGNFLGRRSTGGCARLRGKTLSCLELHVPFRMPEATRAWLNFGSSAPIGGHHAEPQQQPGSGRDRSRVPSARGTVVQISGHQLRRPSRFPSERSAKSRQV